MAEHTATPWKARLIRWNSSEPVLGFAIQPADHEYNVSKHGLSIASLGAAEPDLSAQVVYGADVLEANAAFIVQAVNAHDTLIAALRNIRGVGHVAAPSDRSAFAAALQRANDKLEQAMEMGDCRARSRRREGK